MAIGEASDGVGAADERPSKWAVLGVVAVGVFMATLDASIVNVSLPVISSHFHVPLGAAVEWVVMAYLVTIAALLLTTGRLGDLVGNKWVWVAGLTVFSGGSALCGAAPSLHALIAFRALQGIGGALLMAISPAMLTGAFPPEERGRALGLNAVVVGLGISTGPTLGGVITHAIGWRWIFFVNVPIGIGGIVAALRVLGPERRRSRGRFDFPGAIAFAVALGALTMGMSVVHESGFGSLPFLISMAAFVGGSVALVVLERRRAEPIVDPSLFKNRVFSSAMASLVLAFLSLFAVSFLLPFYLEQLRGLPPNEAGLLLTPLPLTIAIGSPFTGALSDRIGTRPLAVTGFAVCTLGLVLFGFLEQTTSWAVVIAILVLVGIGQCLFMPPNNSALMGAAPKERQGVAAGLLATGRVVGQALSVALAGVVFAAGGGEKAGHVLEANPGDPHAAETFLHAFRLVFWVCAAIAAAGIFTTFVRGDEGKRSQRR